MDRRTALKSLTAGTAGAAFAGDKTSRKQAAPPRRAGSFIEVDSLTSLYHKEWGSGRPAVFLHSWGRQSDLWQYQMIHLAERGVRCIAYDRRGHGRSSDPGRGYEIDTLADDLSAVIESLDLKEVTLIGHSLGCGEIVRYLSRHGSSRTARVVLIAPTLP